MKLEKHTISFVSFGNVLKYLGYSEVHPAEVFEDISFGDTSYSIMSLPWVLESLRDWLDRMDYGGWTDKQQKLFDEKAEELLNEYTFVDMES